VERLSRIDAEIGAAHEQHDREVAAFHDENAALLVSTKQSAERARATAYDRALALNAHDAEVRDLERRLAALKEVRPQVVQEWDDANAALIEAAAAEYAAITTVYERPLPDGVRHIAALQKDRDRVAYQLQLHRARQPLTALFAGVKAGRT